MDATVAFGSPALARDLREAGSRRAVAAWLLACCALVFAMVVVGGVTTDCTLAPLHAPGMTTGYWVTNTWTY